MKPYHKIDSVYKRDPETNYKNFLIGQFTRPEFEMLANVPWHVTEKVDGTNIRIDWRNGEVKFGGRTDKAQLPVPLYDRLQELFTPERLDACFGNQGAFTLYGEGYGAGIQKGGGNYIPDGVDFILFDVLYDDEMWLTQEDVTGVAGALVIDRVPIVAGDGEWTLKDALVVASDFETVSLLGNQDFTLEGFIMRPTTELKDRRGRRIITKVKLKDFEHD